MALSFLRNIGGALVLMGCALGAQASERVERLYDLLGSDDIIAVMVEEGVLYGDTLRRDLFPGRGGARWDATVARIYDPAAMRRVVLAGMDGALSDADIGLLEAFFETERGARIIQLEVGARRAMLDDSIEASAEEAYMSRRANPDEMYDQVAEFIDVNDLVETNVVGGMNANTAFYLGLSDGGAFDPPMSQDDILRDVWSQEPEIREDTTIWVFSYLLLAYAPLEEGDLAAYIALSKSAEGRALNRAIFAGYDALFVDISRALGLAAAQFMAGEEL